MRTKTTIIYSVIFLLLLSGLTHASSTSKKAFYAYNDSQYEKAIKLSQQSLSRDKHNNTLQSQIYNIIGSSYLFLRMDAIASGDKLKEKENTNQAIKNLNQSISKDNTNFTAYMNRGFLYKFTQQYDKSIKDLEISHKLWKQSALKKNGTPLDKLPKEQRQMLWKQTGFRITKELQDARILLEAQTTGPKFPSFIPKFDRQAPAADLVAKGWLANWEGDNKEAMDYFEQASNKGNLNAMDTLGTAYIIGHGRIKNLEKGKSLLIKCGDLGQALCYFTLGDLYRTGKGFKKDYDEAYKWFKKASDEGVQHGQLKIAYAYVYGQGVKKDLNKAKNIMKTLAKNGYDTAQWTLGSQYLNDKKPEKGNFYDIDERKSLKWFKRAAKQGHIKSQVMLSEAYLEGKGVLQDYERAFRWLEQASMQGDPLAQYNLAVMYWNGKGVKKDRNKAKVWFKKSARWGNKSASKALQSIM